MVDEIEYEGISISALIILYTNTTLFWTKIWLDSEEK